jgi:hypothetical protein
MIRPRLNCTCDAGHRVLEAVGATILASNSQFWAGALVYCNKCGKPLRGGDQRFCPECGTPVPLPSPQPPPSMSSSALADPKILVLIVAVVLIVIAFVTLHGFSAVLALALIVIAGFGILRRGIKLEIKLAGLVLGLLIVLVSNGIEGWLESKSQGVDEQHVTKQASAEKQGDASSPSLSTEQSKPTLRPSGPPPKFRVYRQQLDMPTTIVVPLSTTDDQLKGLLWFFREKVRSNQYREIGLTQPTNEQWGQKNYASGMLVVYRGTKCVNEQYVTDAQIAKGNLGPCGYGEHDDAYYQWGIDGDPMKDVGALSHSDAGDTLIFDYHDN